MGKAAISAQSMTCHTVLFTHLAFDQMFTSDREGAIFSSWSWPLVRRQQRKWRVRPWIAKEPTTLSWRRRGCLKIAERTFESIGPPSWLVSFHLFTPCSDWSNRVEPCFPPAEIEHALFPRRAISAGDDTSHTVRINFFRETKSQVFLPLQNASCGNGLN